MRETGSMKPWMIVLLAILVAQGLISLVYFTLFSESEKPVQTQAATLLPELRPLAPFTLVDQRGRTYDNRRLLGRWTLLSFGYTHCPDICPTQLANLAQMKQRLGQLGMQAPYEIAFVSLDPARDTPQVLADYLAYFDRDFLGITGTPAAIDALTRPLGILHRKIETEDSAMGYVVDHSANLILVDPQGRYRALFSPPQDAAIMAQDILAISQSGESR